jgi:hypothetical protein
MAVSIEIKYYRLDPSDMTVEYEPGMPPEPLEDCIETEKPEGLVKIVTVQDDPFHGLTINVYYRTIEREMVRSGL